MGIDNGKLPIIIYSPQKSTRLSYVLDFVFSFFDVEYKVVTEKEDIDFQNIVINYSNQIIPDCIKIPKTKILFESEFLVQSLSPFHWGDLKTIFHVDAEAPIPFDLFGAVFYLITRYEEYITDDLDDFGRFKAINSVAYRQGFLQKPIIDLWIKKFHKNFLVDKDIKWVKEYSFKPSFDIDMAFSYTGKGFYRNVGGSFRDFSKFKLKDVWDRISVLFLHKEDPYFTFPYIEEVLGEDFSKALFFAQVGEVGEYDKNISLEYEPFRNLLSYLDHHTSLGLHPSYQSFLKEEEILKEKKSLETLTSDRIEHSRQHFLKLKMPETYEILDDLKIRHDYTMGYASQPGFRAGTAQSFPFFNLRTNQVTKLTIHPLVAMEVTFHTYLKVTPEQTKVELEKIVNEIKNVDGENITLWHNNSLSDEKQWKNWRTVFEYHMNISK